MRSLEQVRIRIERGPAVPEDEPRVVTGPADLMFPFVRRVAVDDEVEAVVFVLRPVVVLEPRQLADDPDVRQPGLLLDLPEQAVLDALARVEPAGGNLDGDLGMVAVVEDEQLPAP